VSALEIWIGRQIIIGVYTPLRRSRIFLAWRGNAMNASKILAVVLVLHVCLLQGFSAPAKTYQVTGPVIELTDAMIVVQKGDERWEVSRDAATKVDGDLKVGQKVTVHYRMTATRIETKSAGGQSKEKPK
jgi:hypothetical protein